MNKLVTDDDFAKLLACGKAIVYLLVSWSGPERQSRKLFYESLGYSGNNNCPVFELDCDLHQTYVVEWFLNHNSDVVRLYGDGWGSILFVQSGKVVDYIKYPFAQQAELRQKLQLWSNIN